MMEEYNEKNPVPEQPETPLTPAQPEQPVVAQPVEQPAAPTQAVEQPAAPVQPEQPVASAQPVEQPAVPAQPVAPAQATEQPAAPVQPVAPAQPTEQPAAPVQPDTTYHLKGVAGSFGSEPTPPAESRQPGYGAQNAYAYPYAQAKAYGKQATPPQKKKKKMNRGALALLWVILSCAVLSLAAFIGVGVYSFVTNPEYRPPFDVQTSSNAPSVSSGAPSNSLPGTPVDPPPESSSAPSDFTSMPDVTLAPNDGITIEPRPTGEKLTPQEAYARVVDSTVVVQVSFTDQQGEGTGSGVIATQDGYIITNSHVVQDTRNINVKVTTHSGEEYDAIVVGYDRTTDLAVIKINATGLQPAHFGSASEMSVGEEVITVGHPGGVQFSFSMTGGYISGLDRQVGSYSSAGMTYIQTDAAINPGNSGGALVNLYGQVVGINSSKITAEDFENMGFAIPIDKARDILSDLMGNGYVTGRVRLGITGSDVTDAQVFEYDVPYGFVIVSINEDSSFAGTGVEPGDIITAIDGETVESLSDISNKLLEYSPGDTLTVTLYRLTNTIISGRGTGSYFNVDVVLLADNGETQQ